MKNLMIKTFALLILTIGSAAIYSGRFPFAAEPTPDEVRAHLEKVDVYKSSLKEKVQRIDGDIALLAKDYRRLVADRAEAGRMLAALGEKNTSPEMSNFPLGLTPDSAGQDGFVRFIAKARARNGDDFLSIRETDDERSMIVNGDILIQTIEGREKVSVSSAEDFFGMNLLMGGFDDLEKIEVRLNGASEAKLRRWKDFLKNFASGKQIPVSFEKNEGVGNPTLSILMNYRKGSSKAVDVSSTAPLSQ